jgi:hypothetical protein
LFAHPGQFIQDPDEQHHGKITRLEELNALDTMPPTTTKPPAERARQT